MYSVETIGPPPERRDAGVVIASGPSMSADRPSAGSGTTSDDHTVSDSAPSRFAGATTPAWREMTLPIDPGECCEQAQPRRGPVRRRRDRTPRRRGRRCRRARRSVCTRLGGARAGRAPRPRSSARPAPAASRAAMPGCSPSAIDVYNRPNCPRHMNSPTPTTVLPVGERARHDDRRERDDPEAHGDEEAGRDAGHAPVIG